MTTSTNAIKTVATSNIIPASFRTLGVTPKQMSWLKFADTNYTCTVNFASLTNRYDASTLIGSIQEGINDGTFAKFTPTKATTPKSAKRVGAKVWYCIIDFTTSIAIKTFSGSWKEANAGVSNTYGDKVLLVSSNLQFVKGKALELRNSRLTEVKEDVKTSVARDLADLSVEELIEMARASGVKLGNSKKKTTIMARILAVA